MKWWYPSTSHNLIILGFYVDKNKKKAVFLTQTQMLGDILRPADAQVYKLQSGCKLSKGSLTPKRWQT